MYTIQDLTNGVCAVENDGTLEELQDVLKLAFPISNIVLGTDKYYYKSNYVCNIWGCGDYKTLPTQSVKVFLKELNTEKLGEGKYKYWCVKNDNTEEVVNALKNTLGKIHNSWSFTTEAYYAYDGSNRYNGTNRLSDPSFFKNNPIELTKEQFLKIANTQTTEEKKIIGYKCPMDLFGGRLKAGSVFSTYSQEKKVMYCPESSTSGVPTELVKSWEPVYEEVSKDKTFTLRDSHGTFELTVKSGGLYYVPDGAILNPDTIKRMFQVQHHKHLQYEFLPIISHMDMGCKKMVPIEDINDCIEYWEKNFKTNK